MIRSFGDFEFFLPRRSHGCCFLQREVFGTQSVRQCQSGLAAKRCLDLEKPWLFHGYFMVISWFPQEKDIQIGGPLCLSCVYVDSEILEVLEVLEDVNKHVVPAAIAAKRQSISKSSGNGQLSTCMNQKTFVVSKNLRNLDFPSSQSHRIVCIVKYLFLYCLWYIV